MDGWLLLASHAIRTPWRRYYPSLYQRNGRREPKWDGSSEDRGGCERREGGGGRQSFPPTTGTARRRKIAVELPAHTVARRMSRIEEIVVDNEVVGRQVV